MSSGFSGGSADSGCSLTVMKLACITIVESIAVAYTAMSASNTKTSSCIGLIIILIDYLLLKQILKMLFAVNGELYTTKQSRIWGVGYVAEPVTRRDEKRGIVGRY